MSDELRAVTDDDWVALDQASSGIEFDQLKEVLSGTKEGKSLDSITSVKGLVKSFIDTQKMVGDPEKRLPSDEAGWEEFYRKQGKPESADLYNFGALSEYQIPDEVLGKIQGSLYENNLTNEQGVNIVKTFIDLTAADAEKQKADSETKAEEIKKAKEVKFGDKLEEVTNLAEGYLKGIENEAVRETLSGLANTAEGLEYLSKLGAAGLDDDPTGPLRKQPPRGALSAQEQIDRLKSDEEFLKKYIGTDTRIPRKAVEDAQKLMESLYAQAAAEKK